MGVFNRIVENFKGLIIERTKSEHITLMFKSIKQKKIEGAETPDIYYSNASVAERQ